MLKKLVARLILTTFLFTSLGPLPDVSAQVLIDLPAPGMMVNESNPFEPLQLKGILVNIKNPLRFDFLLDKGDSHLSGQPLKDGITRLAKYFLTCLTVPENDLWVNLSPYEKDRIVPGNFGITLMGKDLLEQDYLLKQIMASLSYPENDLGKLFWQKVYRKSYELYGTTNIPINTFNKVWILPKSAEVYAQGNAAFVVKSRLEVMLEADYKAFAHHQGFSQNAGAYSQIFRDVILPELRQEVNEGKNFAIVRQVYNAMILATWYKRHLKDSLLGRMYVGKNRVNGVDIADKNAKEKIFQQYLKAYKKCVYNYIKEDYDPITQQTVPRKYASGGMSFTRLYLSGPGSIYKEKPDPEGFMGTDFAMATVDVTARNGVGDIIRFPDPRETLNTHPFHQIPQEAHDQAMRGGLRRFFNKWAFLVMFAVGTVALSPAAQAEIFTPGKNSTIIMHVEKGDQLGFAMAKIQKAYERASPEAYKKSAYAGSIYTALGRVTPGVKHKDLIMAGHDIQFSQPVPYNVLEVLSGSVAQAVQSPAIVTAPPSAAPLELHITPGDLSQWGAQMFSFTPDDPSIFVAQPSSYLNNTSAGGTPPPPDEGSLSPGSGTIGIFVSVIIALAGFRLSSNFMKGLLKRKDKKKTPEKIRPIPAPIAPSIDKKGLEPEPYLVIGSGQPSLVSAEEKALLPQLRKQLDDLKDTPQENVAQDLTLGTSGKNKFSFSSIVNSISNHWMDIGGALSATLAVGTVWGPDPISLIASAFIFPFITRALYYLQILYHEGAGHQFPKFLLGLFNKNKAVSQSINSLDNLTAQQRLDILLPWRAPQVMPHIPKTETGWRQKAIHTFGFATTMALNAGLSWAAYYFNALGHPWLLPFLGPWAVSAVATTIGSFREDIWNPSSSAYNCGLAGGARWGTARELAEEGDGFLLGWGASMMRVLASRGAHSMGAGIMRFIKGKTNFLNKKAVTTKRGPGSNLVGRVFGALSRSLQPIDPSDYPADEIIVDEVDAHSRWATTGRVTQKASHPHSSSMKEQIMWDISNGRFAVSGQEVLSQVEVIKADSNGIEGQNSQAPRSILGRVFSAVKKWMIVFIAHNGDNDWYRFFLAPEYTKRYFDFPLLRQELKAGRDIDNIVHAPLSDKPMDQVPDYMLTDAFNQMIKMTDLYKRINTDAYVSDLPDPIQALLTQAKTSGKLSEQQAHQLNEAILKAAYPQGIKRRLIIKEENYITNLDRMRGLFMQLVHFKGKLPPGDTPPVPLQIEHELTRGNWVASVRAAHVLVNHNTIDEIENDILSERDENFTGQFVGNVFARFSYILSRPGLENPEKSFDDIWVTEEMAHRNPDLRFQYEAIEAFKQALIVEITKAVANKKLPQKLLVHFSGPQGPGLIEDFVDVAVEKFFTGGRKKAAHEFLKHSKGTYGLFIRTSADPNGVTLVSRQQGLVWGFSLRGRVTEKDFENEGLDFKAITPKLIEKKYLTDTFRPNLEFTGLDDGFKKEFPGLTPDQFEKIENILKRALRRKRYGFASDGDALKVKDPQGNVLETLMHLDSTGEGEIADLQVSKVTGKLRFQLYNYNTQQEVSSKEINERLYPQENNPKVGNLVTYENENRRPIEELNQISQEVKETQDDWDNPNSTQRQSGEYQLELLANWYLLKERVIPDVEYQAIFPILHQRLNDLIARCDSSGACSPSNLVFLRTEGGVRQQKDSVLMRIILKNIEREVGKIVPEIISHPSSSEVIKQKLLQIIRDKRNEILDILSMDKLDQIYNQWDDERNKNHLPNAKDQVDYLMIGYADVHDLISIMENAYRTFFPGLSVRAVSSNKYLDYKNLSFDIYSPKVVELDSKGGSTFPTLVAAGVAVRAVGMKRVCAFTANMDSQLGVALGQRLRPESPFIKRLFLLKRKYRSEAGVASEVLMIQNQLEKLLFLIKRFKEIFPSDNPFGLNVTNEDIQDLENFRKSMLEDAKNTTGRDEFGEKFKSRITQYVKKGKEVKKDVNDLLNKRADFFKWHFWEGAVKASVFWPYVISVSTLGGGLVYLLTGQHYSIATSMLEGVMTLILGGIGLTWLYRLSTSWYGWHSIGGIPFPKFHWARLGDRLGAPPNVSFLSVGPLANKQRKFFGKTQSRGYGAMTTKAVYAGESDDNALAELAPFMLKGSWLIGHLPTNPGLMGVVKMTFKQLKVTKTGQWGTNILASGARSYTSSRAPFSDKDVSDDNIVIGGAQYAPRAASSHAVHRLYDILIDPFGGFLAEKVEMVATVDKTTFGGRLWDYSRIIIENLVHTTASPRPPPDLPEQNGDDAMLSKQASAPSPLDHEGGITMNSSLMQLKVTGVESQNRIRNDDNAVSVPVINSLVPNVSGIVTVTPDMLKAMLGEAYLN